MKRAIATRLWIVTVIVSCMVFPQTLSKSKVINNLLVSENLSAGSESIYGDLTVGGHETVDGTVSAGAFISESAITGTAITVIDAHISGTVTTNILNVSGTTTTTGITNINTSGSAPTFIGNATGNIFFPTDLPPAEQNDSLLVIDPTTGQARLDGSLSFVGAIINDGQPGPLVIGTSNDTSMSFVTSGSNVVRLTIDDNGAVSIAQPTAGVALTLAGNSLNPALVVVGDNSTTAPALQLLGLPAAYSGNYALQLDPTTNSVTQGIIMTTSGTGMSALQADTGTASSYIVHLLGDNISTTGDNVSTITIALADNPTIAGDMLVTGTLTTGSLQATYETITTSTITNLTATLAQIGTLNVTTAATVTGATNINTTGSATTSIGTGSGQVNLGNGSSALDAAGTPISINTAVAAVTAIGTNGGMNNFNGTTNIMGATNINIGSATTATNIGNSQSATNITGATTINGDTVMEASSGIPLSVTGNTSNPTIVATGSSTTTAPALRLLDNPASATTDYLLTIDSSGNVKQSSETLSALILNGGQAGPLTIGTTNDTNMSFMVDNATVITMTASGQIGIGTTAPYEQVVIAGSIPTAAVDSVGTGNDPFSVYVQGRYVYVVNSGSNSLQIFDVSNPTSPTPISTVATGTSPYSVYVQGRYAYVANEGSNNLQLFDVSNPASPALVSTVATGTSPYAVYVQGHYAYVVNSGSSNLQIFDVSNPTSLTSIGTVATGSSPVSIYVQGRYAYIVDSGSDTLQIIDVSNPASPSFVSSINTGASFSVYVQGRYAYVTNLTSLQIIDISNPASPSLVSSINTGASFSVYVQGRYAYVANYGANTLQIIDVSNPTAPLFVGTVSIGQQPRSLYVQGRYVYVVNAASATLQIVDVGGAYIQQLEAGGIEVGTLQTRENMTVNNDFDVKGGAVFGQGFQATGASSIITAANATVPALTVTGYSSQSAPALQLVGNPASGVSDYLLTINPTTGVVGQSAAASGAIIEGGQTGPLVIGTTNDTNMSFITDNATVLTISANGQIGIGTTAPYEQVVIAGSIPTAAIGSIGTDATPHAVYVQGRYAYIANYGSSTLQIFDVSNSASPVSVGTVSTGANPISVYVQGRYAYVANYGSSTLQIFDVSNSASPASVGTVNTGTNPNSVYVQGRYVYVANYGSSTLQIVDVSNPAVPVSVGTLSTGVNGNPTSVYVQGRYAYVVNSNTTTLQIIDVNNPANPVAVPGGSIATGENPQSVYVQGRYAYVANYSSNSEQIIDVSNPSSPSTVSTIVTGAAPQAIYVQGRYAYVLNSGNHNLSVIDVSNPADPLSVGSVSTGSTSYSVYVQGRYAYVVNEGSNSLEIFDMGGAYIQQLEAGGIEVGTLQTRENMTVNNDFDVKGGAVFGQGFQSMGASSIITATNATVPALVITGTNASAALRLAGSPTAATTDYFLTIDSSGNVKQTSGIETVGNVVFSAGQTGPLTIGTTNDTNLNFITDNATVLTVATNGQIGIGTTSPYEQVVITGSVPSGAVGSVETGITPQSVYVQGRYAYVVNYTANTLQIFDVSNSANPVSVGTVSTGSDSNPISVYVQGRYAYVINNGTNTLQIFDVSNPASPISVGTVSTGSEPYDVYVQGRYAYVTNLGAGTLQIIDVSNPASPISVGTISSEYGSYAVYVQGRYAYTVSFNNTLQIIDVSNPADPISVSILTTGEELDDVYVQGSYAYVVDISQSNLKIIDVSNPASPSIVGTIGFSSEAKTVSVYVQGRYAYVLNCGVNTSLQIIDVSNPASPQSVGSVETSATDAGEVYVQGRYAYVATGDGNDLQIFDVGGAYIQQLEAGGIEVGTLQTRENMTVNNDFDVRGGAVFGQGFQAMAASSVVTTATSVPALTLIGSSSDTSATPLNLQGLYSQAAINALNVDASGNVFINSSTKKYKQNIRTMGEESEILYQLRPVIYDPLENRGTGNNIPGFIAEEVYEVSQNPALVCFDGEGMINNVNYTPLYALEIHELQKHQRCLDEQAERHHKELAALRAEIAQLVVAWNALSGSDALNIDIKK